ncbi:MAG: hypothetical protein PUN43_05600 [Candidatus Liberibacter asiaticus]|nr:hypothetical protein [Candidatus Liberibacter asiaticus]
MTLASIDVQIIRGMRKRGDTVHDIASWFGVNQGRIKEAEDGKFGDYPPAPESELPPKGASGLMGRKLYEEVKEIVGGIRENEEISLISQKLNKALRNYDGGNQ